MSAAAVEGVRRGLRLTARSAVYELRKQLAFRTGFIVREGLRGVAHPTVMIFVYAAIFAIDGAEELRGWRLPELVAYLILVAVLGRLVFHERLLDLSEQIFEGRITKFLVMPVRYVYLPLGRFVQYTAVQIVFCAAFWAAGRLLLPRWWPVPVDAAALAQAVCLVLLGSYCFFLFFFVLNALAFWLDVIWSLLVMSRFITMFVAGTLVPVSIMPDPVRAAFAWMFPYWTVCAPIELCLGRAEEGRFAQGLLVLSLSAVALEVLRRLVWARGKRRYTASGM